MKTKTAVILFVIAFFLRPIFQVFLPIWMTLDIAICLYIALAVTSDRDEIIGPMIVAFIYMAVNDIIFSQFVGVTPLAMLAASAFIFLIKTRVDAENVLLDGIVMVVALFIYHTVYWLIYRSLGVPYSFLYMLERLPWLLLTECIITGIMIYFIVRVRVQKRRNEYFK